MSITVCALHPSYKYYGTWRYSYPTHDETQNFVEVPSQALSDALVEALKDKL